MSDQDDFDEQQSKLWQQVCAVNDMLLNMPQEKLDAYCERVRKDLEQWVANNPEGARPGDTPK